MTATTDAVVCAVADSDCVKYRGNNINKKLRYDLKDTILKPKILREFFTTLRFWYQCSSPRASRKPLIVKINIAGSHPATKSGNFELCPRRKIKSETK